MKIGKEITSNEQKIGSKICKDVDVSKLYSEHLPEQYISGNKTVVLRIIWAIPSFIVLHEKNKLVL